MDGNAFQYIILPIVEKDILLEYRSKLACISSFILSTCEKGASIDTLLIDGGTEESLQEGLYKTLSGHNSLTNTGRVLMPEDIIIQPRADVTYDLVNQADRVAYQLKLYHEENLGQIKDKWTDNKLNPNWGYFKHIFDSAGIPNK